MEKVMYRETNGAMFNSTGFPLETYRNSKRDSIMNVTKTFFPH